MAKRTLQQQLQFGMGPFQTVCNAYSWLVSAVDYTLFPVLKFLRLHAGGITAAELSSRFPKHHHHPQQPQQQQQQHGEGDEPQEKHGHRFPFHHEQQRDENALLPPLDKRKKTLVLDLDETLIHSSHHAFPYTTNAITADLTLQVTIDGVVCSFSVCQRPHVDLFLRTVAQWYNVVVFTASLAEYGNPVIDFLDRGRNLIHGRLFRGSCVQQGALFIKDLTKIEPNLANVMIVDNSPGAYEWHQDNAIPISSWFDDRSDTDLLDLLPMLDALRFTKDVRSVLSLRRQR